MSIDLINQFLVFFGRKVDLQFFQMKVFGPQIGAQMVRIIQFGQLEIERGSHLPLIALFFSYIEFF
jgi:hypothetical protein